MQSAEVASYADELQLYYHATKKFRGIYQKQEHQLYCPAYGSPLEACIHGQHVFDNVYICFLVLVARWPWFDQQQRPWPKDVQETCQLAVVC